MRIKFHFVFIIIATLGVITSCKQKEPRDITVEAKANGAELRLLFMENNNEIAREYRDAPCFKLTSRSGEALPDREIRGSITNSSGGEAVSIILIYANGKLKNIKSMNGSIPLAETEIKDEEKCSFHMKVYDEKGMLKFEKDENSKW